MIKLSSIATTNSDTTYTVTYTDDKNNVLTAKIPKQNIDRRLVQVQEALGRDVTDQDWKDAVKAEISQVRETRKKPRQVINTAAYIDVDLEVT